MFSFVTRARRAGQMKTSIAGLAAAMSLAFAPTTASAATYVYNLVASLTGGGATGTITTDTNTGVLALSNILSWSLTIDAGLGPVSIDSTTGRIFGNYSNGITATADGLFFDFSGSPTQYIQFHGAELSQNTTFLAYCSGLPGCMAGFEQATIQAQARGASFRYAGVQRIASIAAAPGGVPEPATWALMIGGFGLAGATLRRRRALAGA